MRYWLANSASSKPGFSPVSIQLRYLQTMREISSERNTTTFFPIPVDLLGPVLGAVRESADGGARG